MSRKPMHELSGKTILVSISGNDDQGINGKEMYVSDWFINMNNGVSWSVDYFKSPKHCCYRYGLHLLKNRPIPVDDEVIFGLIEGEEYLIHSSEIGKVLSL